MELKVRSVRIIAAALKDIPGTAVKPGREGREGYPIVIVRTAGETYPLQVMWAGEGWPSDVSQAVAGIRRKTWPRQAVVTARRFSPGSLQMLRDWDANWADETGQARIVVPPGLLILREPQMSPKKPSGQSRWSPSAIAIAELIIHRGLTELRTGELAKEMPWTEGAVSQALATFDSQGWTVGHGGKSGRGTWRELANPAAMLDSWAAHVGSEERPKRLGHRAVRDLLRFAETELRDALGWEERTWALTTWAGLEVSAPFVTVVPVVHVYVSTERFISELDGVLRKAGLREVEEGARVEFWEADFPLITQPGQPSQIPVASTPRLYADLLALGGRGADAAQHLRETRLGF